MGKNEQPWAVNRHLVKTSGAVSQVLTGTALENTGAPTAKDAGASDLDKWLAKHGDKIYSK